MDDFANARAYLLGALHTERALSRIVNEAFAVQQTFCPTRALQGNYMELIQMGALSLTRVEQLLSADLKRYCESTIRSTTLSYLGLSFYWGLS